MAGVYCPILRYQPSFAHCSRPAKSLSPPSNAGFSFSPHFSPCLRLTPSKFLGNHPPKCNASESSSTVVSGKSPELSRPSFRLTYLEGNSWLWDVGGFNVLVDPILVGNLDFGIPWFYDAAKKFLKKFTIEDLPKLDCLLITQNFEDHCHVKTLKPLSELHRDIPVVATPNAESTLSPLFKNVTYLNPGERHEIVSKKGIKLSIQASAGPVLGPPWQRPENGYIVKNGEFSPTLYYEPHCVYNESLLEREKVDIIITPVIKQVLPFYTLVSGQEDAVKLAKLLQAKFVVVLRNGELDSKGILASIVRREGTIEAFKELMSREVPEAQILMPTAGVALDVPVASGES